MFTFKAGAAGGAAAARGMVEYLLEQQVPKAVQRSAEYYARSHRAAEGDGAAPAVRADMAPELAERLGLKPGEALDRERFAHILRGLRADGGAIPGRQKQVASYGEGADERHRIGWYDFTFSAPKSVSVMWAFSGTQAEQAGILQAHRAAVQEALRYVERHVARARIGSGGQGGREGARMAWIAVDHYTSRPTVDLVCTDPTTGENYTRPVSAKIAGDPQLHTHAIVPTAVWTESGRMASLDTMALHGRVREAGSVYQAVLVRELGELGIRAATDPERDGLAYLPAVPREVAEAFSKRHENAVAMARERAAERGLDWETATPEQRVGFLNYGAHASRQDKETNVPDLAAWRDQAQRMGWSAPASWASYGPPAPTRSEVERLAAVSEAAAPHLDAALKTSAVVNQGEVRAAIARGLIAEGGGSGEDVDAIVRRWAREGVRQDGETTRLLVAEDERGSIRMTTELHRDRETELVRLARDAAEDRTNATPLAAVRAAVAASGISYDKEHGRAQLAAVERIAEDGGLSVMIGAAGTGKTQAMLPPLVQAWRAEGREVYGTALAWRQASELEGAGIERANVRALAPFLDAARAGRIALSPRSVVVLDELGQVGTRDALELLRLRERHGFKLVALGDDKQASAIEAGPVIDLLRDALGPERVPEILSTVRQRSKEERRIAGLVREGKVAEALAAKRQDGSAELVAGGYQDAMRRVASLWAERRRETAGLGGYTITISAPTNADARMISLTIRDERRAMGEVTGPDHEVRATDGRGGVYILPLAQGDRVRLYSRTRAMFGEGSSRKSAVVGDNGSVLTVERVLPTEGVVLRGASGKVGVVPWTALRDAGTGRVLLAHGDCLTVDSAQGVTSDEHILALPAGSRALDNGRAYVGASRHRVRSYVVGSEGAELREMRERRPAGLAEPDREQARTEAWRNVERNLSREGGKEGALAWLGERARTAERAVEGFQAGLRPREARRQRGEAATQVRVRQAHRAAERAVPALAEGVGAAAEQYRVVRESLDAMHAYCADRTGRRVEVAARLVAEGVMPYGEGLKRVIGAELADQRRGLSPDPIHGVVRRPKGTEGIELVERRVERLLEAAIDRYDAGQGAAVPAEKPAARTRARQSSGQRA